MAPQGASLRGAWRVLLLVLLVVLAFGLLYAYRAQSPAAPTIAFGQLIAEVEAGQVRSITVVGDHAKVDLIDGSRQEATVSDRGALERAVAERNRAEPGRGVVLRYEEQASTVGLIGSVILSLLPIVLLGVLIIMAARSLTRARAPHKYELLARLADLRDRGAITEEEFQREKRSILGGPPTPGTHAA